MITWITCLCLRVSLLAEVRTLRDDCVALRVIDGLCESGDGGRGVDEVHRQGHSELAVDLQRQLRCQ
jgi:hypothetical protein